MTREEMKKITHGFVEEIMRLPSEKEARELTKRIRAFFRQHKVPDDCNELLTSGFGEALHMLCGWTCEEKMDLIRRGLL